jgi:WD40 repeat protein
MPSIQGGEFMRGHPPKYGGRVTLSLVLSAIIVISSARSFGSESIRSELIRQQNDKGLTFGWTENGDFHAVLFKEHRVVSLRDPKLAHSLDAFDFNDHRGHFQLALCLSHDQRKAVVWEQKSGEANLEIFDRESKLVRVFASNVAQLETRVTSQCWSPDDTQLVYGIEGATKIYETRTDTSRLLVTGKGPTWSPDGDWIAFLDHGTYYAIRPDGGDRKTMFHSNGAVSALYWSPDSRIVAYVRELGFLNGGFLDAEANQLRVRRLQDGSEDRLCPDNVSYDGNYQWLMSDELINRLGTAAPHSE